jgi:hypothetical protein
VAGYEQISYLQMQIQHFMQCELDTDAHSLPRVQHCKSIYFHVTYVANPQPYFPARRYQYTFAFLKTSVVDPDPGAWKLTKINK